MDNKFFPLQLKNYARNNEDDSCNDFRAICAKKTTQPRNLIFKFTMQQLKLIMKLTVFKNHHDITM